jgi:ABC-type siderophore export system fused ATPase/permease subunit
LGRNIKLWQVHLLLTQIHHVTKVDDEKGNNRDRVSTGQIKRLAFVNASMGERPLLILDEWASEQDRILGAAFMKHSFHTLKKGVNNYCNHA